MRILLRVSIRRPALQAGLTHLVSAWVFEAARTKGVLVLFRNERNEKVRKERWRKKRGRPTNVERSPIERMQRLLRQQRLFRRVIFLLVKNRIRQRIVGSGFFANIQMRRRTRFNSYDSFFSKLSHHQSVFWIYQA